MHILGTWPMNFVGADPCPHAVHRVVTLEKIKEKKSELPPVLQILFAAHSHTSVLNRAQHQPWLIGWFTYQLVCKQQVNQRHQVEIWVGAGADIRPTRQTKFLLNILAVFSRKTCSRATASVVPNKKIFGKNKARQTRRQNVFVGQNVRQNIAGSGAGANTGWNEQTALYK